MALISVTPPPVLKISACAAGLFGALLRPVSALAGHFRLFVLLIVDLTRIQPNIQRTALAINRFVPLNLNRFPLIIARTRFLSFLSDDKRGVFIYSRCVFFRLMAALHGYTCCYLCGRAVCVCMRV